MFNFLCAPNSADLLTELERFIEHWYGPRRTEYGEAEGDLLSLPVPLKRFLAFAGRWPSPRAAHDEAFIYTGGGGHHLQPLSMHSVRKDGKLVFFMEYQGDWDGLTLTSGEDPPVWISGHIDPDSSGRRIRKVSDSLSAFLVTHLLMATAYDDDNSSECGSWSPLHDGGRVSPGGAVRIWAADGCTCPNYEGEFFWRDGLLIHESGGFTRWATRPGGT